MQILTQHRAVSVDIDESHKILRFVDVGEVGSSKSVKIPCRSLVISAGSWSARVFSELFPNARLRLPMVPEQPAANWLCIRNPHRIPEKLPSCDQVFLNEVVEPINLDMSSFANGDIHVASGFASPDTLPETPEHVQVQWNATELMKLKASENLDLRKGEDIEVVTIGRAFLPETLSRIPLITKLPSGKLFSSLLKSPGELDSSMSDLDDGNQIDAQGGVFVNAGHFTDGLTLGLGSGKVMSEIIEGRETSIDVSAFSV